MRKISAVIGANYGDEGKGLIADYLSSKGKCLVVRYNGGAQAGHTVCTPDNKRHVFHHFGSGTLNGSATFLSQYFIVAPMFFLPEYLELNSKCDKHILCYLDPRCRLSTPYDIMLNHAIEVHRGHKKHGSCGMGINETVLRDEIIPLRASELVFRSSLDPKRLKDKLIYIREEYTKKRAIELGVDPGLMPFLELDVLIDRFIEDSQRMIGKCVIVEWEQCRWDYDIVFEGAQGLRLDEEHRNFPHVTRSKTGIPNIKKLMKSKGLQDEEIDVYYVTRTYLTRHGEGPFPGEFSDLLDYEREILSDDTNVFNTHQGNLRFGVLNLDDLNEEIREDLNHVGELKVNPSLVITFADKISDAELNLCYIKSGVIERKNIGELISDAKFLLPKEFMERWIISRGKTRADVNTYTQNATEYGVFGETV